MIFLSHWVFPSRSIAMEALYNPNQAYLLHRFVLLSCASRINYQTKEYRPLRIGENKHTGFWLHPFKALKGAKASSL